MVYRVVALLCLSLFLFDSNIGPFPVDAYGSHHNIQKKLDLPREPQSEAIDKETFKFSLSTENAKKQSHLLLLSLQWTDCETEGKFSKPVADIWRWKDSVLGDGRDFFVPKPNTLRALQSYLISHGNSRCFEISECVVLSNCARFEILLAIKSDTQSNQQKLSDIVVSEISSLLTHQVQSHLKNKNAFMTSASAVMDWPGLIHSNPRPTDDVALRLLPEIQEVSKYWTALSGPRDIAHHLCLVAAVLTARPRRPNREIVFQPFSSRDAHILLQLKRTVDIVADKKGSSEVHSSSNLLTILKFAIQAGKAARNPHQLPALLELRNQYGETGNSRKYDMVPPPEMMQKVIQAVHNKVIDPTVKQCVDHFIAKEAAMDITIFRNHALSMAENQLERQFIQSKLHEPTLRLRQMKPSGTLGSDQAFRIIQWNASVFWEQLTVDLTELRQNVTSNRKVQSRKT